MTTAQKIIKYCAIAFAVFLIVSIIGGIVGAVASVPLLVSDGDGIGEMKTYAVTEAVKNLEIDLRGARLEIKTGDRFAVESDHKYLKVENADGTLAIKEDRPAFGFYSEGAQVTLMIPDNFTFDKAAVSTGAGTVKIDTLTATTRASINSGAGELRIGGGELAGLDLNIGVGEADLESRLTGNCSIDYGVGELNLTLTGTPDDYCITLEKGVGKATLDGAKMSDDVVYGDGEASIEIDGGVGDMKIEFAA